MPRSRSKLESHTMPCHPLRLPSPLRFQLDRYKDCSLAKTLLGTILILLLTNTDFGTVTYGLQANDRMIGTEDLESVGRVFCQRSVNRRWLTGDLKIQK